MGSKATNGRYAARPEVQALPALHAWADRKPQRLMSDVKAAKKYAGNTYQDVPEAILPTSEPGKPYSSLMCDDWKARHGKAVIIRDAVYGKPPEKAETRSSTGCGIANMIGTGL